MIATRAIDDEMVEIAVSDSGPGISQDMPERIFEPFFSTKGTNELGLGLSICLRIIEAHGGHLTVAKSPDGGAMFWFALPGHPLTAAP